MSIFNGTKSTLERDSWLCQAAQIKDFRLVNGQLIEQPEAILSDELDRLNPTRRKIVRALFLEGKSATARQVYQKIDRSVALKTVRSNLTHLEKKQMLVVSKTETTRGVADTKYYQISEQIPKKKLLELFSPKEIDEAFKHKTNPHQTSHLISETADMEKQITPVNQLIQLTRTEREVFKVLKNLKEATSTQIAETRGTTQSAALQTLNSLFRKGLTGRKKNPPSLSYVYFPINQLSENSSSHNNSSMSGSQAAQKSAPSAVSRLMSVLSELEPVDLKVLKVINEQDGISPIPLGKKVNLSRYSVLPITEKLERLELIIRRLKAGENETAYCFHMAGDISLEDIQLAIQSKEAELLSAVRSSSEHPEIPFLRSRLLQFSQSMIKTYLIIAQSQEELTSKEIRDLHPDNLDISTIKKNLTQLNNLALVSRRRCPLQGLEFLYSLPSELTLELIEAALDSSISGTIDETETPAEVAQQNTNKESKLDDRPGSNAFEPASSHRHSAEEIEEETKMEDAEKAGISHHEFSENQASNPNLEKVNSKPESEQSKESQGNELPTLPESDSAPNAARPRRTHKPLTPDPAGGNLQPESGGAFRTVGEQSAASFLSGTQASLEEVLKEMIQRLICLETRFSRVEDYLTDKTKLEVNAAELLEMLHSQS